MSERLHDVSGGDVSEGGESYSGGDLTLWQWLVRERVRYWQVEQESGGTAPGFRSHVTRAIDAATLEARKHEALMIAATQVWQRPARKKGPDLFSIAGEPVLEYFTRPKYVVPDDTELDDDDKFEKVHQDFATVADADADAVIKLRNAARAGESAEHEMKRVDRYKRLAKGNVATRLRDLI